jgi:16S rRNA (guanine966-N2)-methyltransferase
LPNRPPKPAPRQAPAQSSLRIIGGIWRSRKLLFPCIDGLRPTADRIRETLFNWLAADIHQARCLDVCAGSGALGFEAISRGASLAVMLDNHPAAVEQLKANCKTLQTDQVQVHRQDALSFLKAGCAQPFTLIFLDPPFAANLWQPLAEALQQGHWLAPEALIYVEAPLNQTLQLPASWRLIKDKKAGQVAFRLYRYTAQSAHTHTPALGDSA